MSSNESGAKQGKSVYRSRMDGLRCTDTGLVVTENMLNLFSNIDIERRFLNIVGIEIMKVQFELKEPPSLRRIRKTCREVRLQDMYNYGRSSTVEQYFGVEPYTNHKKPPGY